MKPAPIISLLLAFAAAFTQLASGVSAHCDTLDGPVVQAAREALQKRDVTPVLKWVKADDETQIREAFAKTLKVRALSDDARDVADLHFFETLVRLHRAGEGENYTGLKPGGQVEAGIAAADKALVEGSLDKLAAGLSQAVTAGVRDRFARVRAAKAHADDSVEAGRKYVAAYVEYIHFVEAVRALATAPTGEQHHIHDPAR